MHARSRSWPAMLVLLAALLSANVFYSRPAHSDVDINVFYNALAPYGTWVDHSAYGRVWYPRGVAAGWRPYTDGHWAYNDQYGWIWVSDWAWGWAPFHYGRWVWDDWYGWLWVPGRVWAPAWVFWRYGGGYAAWAPMPPNAYWQPGYGLNTRYFNYDRDLRRNWWVSVPDRHLNDRYMRRYLINPHYNDRVLNVTNNFVNVTNVNNVIVNQGIPVRDIEKRTGRRIRSIPIREVERPQDRRGGRNRDALTVIRPKLAPPDAGDIRRQEEIAQRLSSQNEQRLNQGRSDREREDRRTTPLPERLRRGAPDSESGRNQRTAPSFAPQPDRRGEDRSEQSRQADERRLQEEREQRARGETLRQQQLQEREEQQQQRDERRRQQEQADRARDESVWRQKAQEREQQRQQHQLDEQRRQQEQADRAREEAMQQRQRQQREEQQRQQLQQRQMEERRRQAEQNERSREEAIRQRQLQQQQLQEQRRQQLQQQQQFEEQRRQQQINMQRQRQEIENADQQRRQQQQQQMPRQDHRYGR